MFYLAGHYSTPFKPYLTASAGQIWNSQLSAGTLATSSSSLGGTWEWVWNGAVKPVLDTPLLLLAGILAIVLIGFLTRRPRQTAGETIYGLPVQDAPKSPHSELSDALAACRSAFFGIGIFSGMSNVLMLTGAFYMLQVYDRVLPSRSVPTLVALSVLAAGLFIAQGVLDLIRSRILLRIGAYVDEKLSGRVFDTVVRLPLKTQNKGDGLQPLRDLDTIRNFLSGQGPAALFDLPWMPIYLAIIFSFHPMLGVTALVGAIILICLTLLTELMTRKPVAAASSNGQQRNGIAEASRRNAEVITAMGMAGRIRNRWAGANSQYMDSNRQLGDVTGGFGAMSRTLRMMLQSAVLGIGAYFVIHGQASAGIIIAGSILVSRALAPVDLAIANWRGFVGARQSRQRLVKLLNALPPQVMPMALPAPASTLAVESVSAVPPGHSKVVVQDVGFELKAGAGMGVIGPSGSGKSCLARLLVGVWQPVRGKVRLDGASLDQWSPETIGPHIGYLPQDVELFAGTIADNIARFDPEATPDGIIAAAKAAGVHEMIIAMPGGYETELGEAGVALSAGQRQRVGLARALYGDPFLVVLDEPNSNLDADGEKALTQAILGIRKRNGIAVVVAHRPSALAGVDMLLAMNQGRLVAFGPRDEVAAKVFRAPAAAAASPLKVVPATAGN
ncbi:MAG: type I secretion system permease/ATPase [Hyphomicrobiales bacterium]|nr:type I secretion system permease/ATPase [Hyphomicrobiales bacterium]